MAVKTLNSFQIEELTISPIIGLKEAQPITQDQQKRIMTLMIPMEIMLLQATRYTRNRHNLSIIQTFKVQIRSNLIIFLHLRLLPLTASINSMIQ